MEFPMCVCETSVRGGSTMEAIASPIEIKNKYTTLTDGASNRTLLQVFKGVQVPPECPLKCALPCWRGSRLVVGHLRAGFKQLMQ